MKVGIVLFVQTFATMFIVLSRYLLRYGTVNYRLLWIYDTVVNLNAIEPIQLFKKT